MENEQLLQALSDMIDKKLDAKISPINNRLDKMGNRLDSMENRLDSMGNRLDSMGNRLDSMENRLDSMGNRLDSMENRLGQLESEMSAMRTGQMELIKEIIEVKQKVNDTYELALDAWGQSTENRTWLDKTFKM